MHTRHKLALFCITITLEIRVGAQSSNPTTTSPSEVATSTSTAISTTSIDIFKPFSVNVDNTIPPELSQLDTTDIITKAYDIQTLTNLINFYTTTTRLREQLKLALPPPVNIPPDFEKATYENILYAWYKPAVTRVLADAYCTYKVSTLWGPANKLSSDEIINTTFNSIWVHLIPTSPVARLFKYPYDTYAPVIYNLTLVNYTITPVSTPNGRSTGLECVKYDAQDQHFLTVDCDSRLPYVCAIPIEPFQRKNATRNNYILRAKYLLKKYNHWYKLNGHLQRSLRTVTETPLDKPCTAKTLQEINIERIHLNSSDALTTLVDAQNFLHQANTLSQLIRGILTPHKNKHIWSKDRKLCISYNIEPLESTDRKITIIRQLNDNTTILQNFTLTAPGTSLFHNITITDIILATATFVTACLGILNFCLWLCPKTPKHERTSEIATNTTPKQVRRVKFGHGKTSFSMPSLQRRREPPPYADDNSSPASDSLLDLPPPPHNI